MSAPDALPVALPAASSDSVHLPTSGVHQGGSGAGNTPPSPVRTARGQARLGARQLGRVAGLLSERDIRVVREVRRHRFLSTKHLEALIFAGHASQASAARSCRRVLERLRRDGLIEHLERRVGGIRAGSAGHVWHLTHAGSRLLTLLDGDGTPTRFREPSQRLLDHYLMVADIHLALRTGASGDGFELLDLALEPASWRRYTGIGGEPRLIRPDLAAVTASGDYQDSWLLEADTGSEHPPTVVRACRRYLDYFATGIEQASSGVIPRVVWVVPHDARADKLRGAFARARLDRSLFRVTTLARLVEAIGEGAE